MNHPCRTSCIVLLLAAAVSMVSAQKVGTSSLQFLKVMPTARATAMGDAFVSLAEGADAVFWNPAGLSTMHGHEISSTLTMWLFSTTQVALAYGMPMGDWGNIGFQFQYVDFGTIEETRAEAIDVVDPVSGERFFSPGLTGRSFSPYSILVGGSYARSFTDHFSAGLAAKYVKESLWADQITSEGGHKTYAEVALFDFGMKYNTGYRSVQIGVSIQNFGPQVTFAAEAHPAPMAFRLGASANLIGSDALVSIDQTNRVTLAYDLLQPNDYEQQMQLGAEYCFSDIVALRMGYKVNYDTEGLTFGFGLHATVSDNPISFDYSYGKMSEYLNSVARLTLGVQFR